MKRGPAAGLVRNVAVVFLVACLGQAHGQAPPVETEPPRVRGDEVVIVPGEASPPAAADGPPSNPAAPPALAPAPPPAPPDLAGRLDDIEQLARISARKYELLEEESARRGKESGIVSIEDTGFALRRADGSYALKVRGLLQADARFFSNDDALEAGDTFLLRRFRPSIDGTLFSLIDYRLVPEFAGTVQIMDAYADIRPWPWLRLRMGKFKGPIGLERLQTDADLPILERALDSNLSSTRELGVQIWGDVGGGIAQYAVGVFNGSVDGTNPDTDINHAKDLNARIFFQPFRAKELADELGSLGIGFAASIGNRKGRLPTSTAAAVTGLPAFRTAGQITFFQYFAPANDTTGATTAFSHELESHLNPELYYYYDTFGLLAEYVVLRQGVQRGNSTTILTHQSAHATLSYAIGGREGFDGVTPVTPFDPKLGAWGALEIAVRWAWLQVDSATFGDPNVPGSVQYADPLRSARTARSWTGGLTWVPRRSFHLAADFEQTVFKGGAGTAAAPADRKTENVFIARAQFNF